ncbi:MAG: proline--tRNA ligase [Candidatus Aenigmarchaeota archaeon]|nr:proline--tRNA ligase [Candidatus Aenigmarchaeota archaeon]
MSSSLGVTVKRNDDFSKWYLEVVRKGNFIDQRSPVKGFDVILPWGYSIWEQIQSRFDAMIKKSGVQNAYFPLLIPERLIGKEEEHLKGFRAETATVTEAGGEKLEERFAIRPTSETIMYYMFSLWIRSYKDLPLKINQWNNVVRWDTKVTRPFIRGREYLWQECHTTHETKEDAEKQVDDAVAMYMEMHRNLAMRPLVLQRPKSDTFAGAEFSVVLDTLMQDGKVVQGPGTHMLGQHFSKPFNIKFLDNKEKENHVWQTCWGMSTREIGMLIMHHGDDSGAILPPAVAPYQAVIIPILFKGKEEKTMEEAKKMLAHLEKLSIRAYLDDRNYSAGFKFNEWELRGVPLRIEIGPKDMEAKEITIVRRLYGKKEKLKVSKLNDISSILDSMQSDMLKKSEKFLKENIHDVRSLKEIKSGFSRSNWCGSDGCEKNVRTSGAEIRGTLYRKEEKPFSSCISCGKTAKHVVYIAKAY